MFNFLQHLANGLLLITGALLGWMHFILSEGKHLRAFREAKKSLEVKMVIEEQSAEQVKLYPNSDTGECELLLRNKKPGAFAALRSARACGRENATGSGFRRFGAVQENLHESARKCQVGHPLVYTLYCLY